MMLNKFRLTSKSRVHFICKFFVIILVFYIFQVQASSVHAQEPVKKLPRSAKGKKLQTPNAPEAPKNVDPNAPANNSNAATNANAPNVTTNENNLNTGAQGNELHTEQVNPANPAAPRIKKIMSHHSLTISLGPSVLDFSTDYGNFLKKR